MGNKNESNFQSGFARVYITPPLGIALQGYYIERVADGILDDLEINAVAISKDNVTSILMTIDHCGLFKPLLDIIKKEISVAIGVEEQGVFIHCTHTRTAPYAMLDSENQLISSYVDLIIKKATEAAKIAFQDLKNAKVGFAIGTSPNVSFIRRFRMKDGSVKTNPGVNNPDIVSPIGEVDERVNVLRIDRENASTIIMANFGNHPDTVGGCKISRDWPGFVRTYTERAIENVNCIFFNGAQGDVNHVNVHPKGGDMNDMFIDFDGCSRGYEHAKHIGRVVAGAIMQVYSKVKYFDVESIRYVQKYINVPSNKPDVSDLPLAHKYNNLHNAGKDDEIPFKEMMLTTVVAEAARMVRLENAPEYFPLLFSVIAIGKVAFFGIPGEPFTGVGRGLKEAEGWDLILPCCNTNAKEGYFPMQDAYDEGGYEARSSNFKSGTAERIIKEGLEILAELK
ncbi:MAG: hypothetical protein IJX16_00800 [Clostridia bacterium]|nr:hypothetical protein [Clostridia bacterium]